MFKKGRGGRKCSKWARCGAILTVDRNGGGRSVGGVVMKVGTRQKVKK